MNDTDQVYKAKVLIITYYWPPFAGSGVQRWLKFTKYLPQFGYKPYVYTPSNPHYNLTDEDLMSDIHKDLVELKRPIWEPYKIAEFLFGKKTNNSGLVGKQNKSLVKKIMGSIRANFFIPDPRRFWIKPSVKYLKQTIEKEGIDYIITTGPPHSLHLIGLKLKQHFPNLKWLADIRDPWSKFDFLKSFGSSQRALIKQAESEARVLSQCDHVLATSQSMKDLLVEFDESKFTCITNGFDREDFENIESTVQEKDTDTLVFYHAGLLNQLRNPIHLWEALNKVCLSDESIDKKLKIHLVGVIDPQVIDSISKYDRLRSNLFIEGYKSHSEVIQDYFKADVLLLLVNNSDNAAANIPGKLFEYLALNKKILSISAANADVRSILQDVEGTLNLTYEDSTEKVALETSKLIKKELKSVIEKDDAKNKYSRLNLTNDLVNLLEQL